MTQGSQYIFCLQDKQNNFWRINSDGSVTISSQPYFLDFAPAGWDDIAIQNIRNKRYWGIDRSVSVPLAYVNDGALIAKHVFYTYGIEEPLFLRIAALTLDYDAGVSYGYWYKHTYRGEVDLSTFLHGGARITCTTLEDGLPKYLRANESTTEEFPMAVPECIFVKMDGINLHNRVENFVSNSTGTGLFDFNNHLVDILITLEDAPYVAGKKSVDRLKVANNNIDIHATQSWFLKSTIDATVELDYNFEVNLEFEPNNDTPNPAAEFYIVVRRINQSGFSDLQSILLHIPSSAGTNRFTTTKHVVGTSSIVVRPDDELYLFAFCTVQGAGGDSQIRTTYTMTDPSFFKYKYKYRHAATYVRAFRAQYLMTNLIDRLTEGTYTAAISRFLSDWSNIVITCGNALRGLDDAVMKISWTTFFEFWDCFSSVGIKVIDNEIDIDEKYNLVDADDFIDLGEPSIDSFKVSVAKEYLFNELEIGYPEIKNEIGVLNGTQAFNTKFLFSLGVTKSPAKLTKVSPIKADPYEIEAIRITTFNKDTTDYKADNELFALDIEGNAQPMFGFLIPEHYLLQRIINSFIEGLLEPLTVFNVGLSPKRNLKRNGRFLRSSTFRGDNLNLKFKSADRNADMILTGVAEKADENIGALGDKFFEPILFDGEFPMTGDDLSLLEMNPLQVFRFIIQNNYYKGILIKGGIAPSSAKVQSFQLLSTADNDLNKLIEYYG